MTFKKKKNNNNNNNRIKKRKEKKRMSRKTFKKELMHWNTNLKHTQSSETQTVF